MLQKESFIWTPWKTQKFNFEWRMNLGTTYIVRHVGNAIPQMSDGVALLDIILRSLIEQITRGWAQHTYV